MLRRISQSGAGIIYGTILIMALMAGNADAQLVTNGSFEDTEPGVFTDALTSVDGWVLQLMDGAVADFEVVSETAQHGSQSLKVTPQTLGANQWSIQAVADSIPVTTGHTYQFSMWAKSETSGAQINITVGNYAYSEYQALRPVNLTAEWQQFTMEFTVSDNQTFIRAPVHFNYPANTGNPVYIDHLVIWDPSELQKPVVIEAESGDVGSDFSVLQEDDISYVSIQTNATTFYPGSSARMIGYEVTFPDTGTYDLFVRLRTGAGTFDDDSFFYGNGFGEKDSSTETDWVYINGLAAAGFSDPASLVLEAGGEGSQIWKWVNVSRNAYQGGGVRSFTVPVDSLTKIFQIGAREDGLDIDKIAFGKSYLYYTVENLDSMEAGTTELPGEVWEGPPLASNQPKFVGNVHSANQIQNFESYWNKVTPENAGKWGSVEGTRDNMNWGALDAAYNFAKDNDFPFHFHVLVWGSQQPAWISSLPPEEQLEEIREWFQAVADRYPDIDYLEVVNEPLLNHNPPDGTSGRADYKDALGGDGATGWDWVLAAFRMAREIFPAGTKLILNDFSIINSSSSTSQYLKIIRLLQAENLIDIIAEQAHAFTTRGPVVTMKQNLDSLASTGLPIHITEFDIDGPTDAIQLQDYQRVFPALYEHPGVAGITLWGWRPGLWRSSANLINSDGSERPALEWLRQYLDSVSVDPVAVENIAEAPHEFLLYDNYPNPFNPVTHIRYGIARTSSVTLRIFDLMGREIQTLVDEVQSPGQYTVTFNGQNLSSGIYFYSIRAGSYSETKKFMLLQ